MRYIVLVALLLGVCIGMATDHYALGPSLPHQAPMSNESPVVPAATPAIATTIVNNQVNAKPKDNETENDAAAAAEFNRELIHKGEGFDRPAERQLEDKFEIFSKVPGFEFKGDKSSAHDRKAWAQRNAHVIFVKTGHRNWKFGDNILYRESQKVRIVLSVTPDGKGITASEYTAAGGEKPHRIAATNQPNAFVGGPDNGHLFSYEYLLPAG